MAGAGVVRGIRIGRGYQSFGSVSQSCFSSPGACWLEARAFPQPSNPSVRNATTVVERKVTTSGEMKLMESKSKKEAAERD